MRLFVALALCAVTAVAVFAKEAVPPKLDPETFDRYLGTYQLRSGRLLVVARTELRLYVYEPGSELQSGAPERGCIPCVERSLSRWPYC